MQSQPNFDPCIHEGKYRQTNFIPISNVIIGAGRLYYLVMYPLPWHDIMVTPPGMVYVPWTSGLCSILQNLNLMCKYTQQISQVYVLPVTNISSSHDLSHGGGCLRQNLICLNFNVFTPLPYCLKVCFHHPQPSFSPSVHNPILIS